MLEPRERFAAASRIGFVRRLVFCRDDRFGVGESGRESRIDVKAVSERAPFISDDRETLFRTLNVTLGRGAVRFIRQFSQSHMTSLRLLLFALLSDTFSSSAFFTGAFFKRVCFSRVGCRRVGCGCVGCSRVGFSSTRFRLLAPFLLL